MVKPLAERGFKISLGKYNNIEYKIDYEGLEDLSLFSIKNKYRVSITLDNGKIKSIAMSGPEISTHLRVDDNGFITSDLPQQAAQRSLKQAEEIYRQAINILDIEKKLREHCPRFSNELEINPFNVLGIEGGNLESFIKEGNKDLLKY